MFSGVFEPQDTVLLELVQVLTFSLDKSVVLTSQLSEYKKKRLFENIAAECHINSYILGNSVGIASGFNLFSKKFKNKFFQNVFHII